MTYSENPEVNPVVTQEFIESLVENDGFLQRYKEFIRWTGVEDYEPNEKLVLFISKFLKLKVNYDHPTT